MDIHFYFLLNTNTSINWYNVTTTSNTYVSPFGAFAELDISSDRVTLGDVIAVYPIFPSTNPCSCNASSDRTKIYVFSRTAATGAVRVVFKK